jgi:hypothetical protein
MTAITVTAAKVNVVYPENAHIRTGIAVEALTKGSPVYLVAASGKFGIADANVASKLEFRGVALKAAAADQQFSYVSEGYFEGFDLSGLNYGDLVYLSDIAGYDTVSGSNLIPVGRVMPIPNGTTISKVLQVEARTVENWQWGQ